MQLADRTARETAHQDGCHLRGVVEAVGGGGVLWGGEEVWRKACRCADDHVQTPADAECKKHCSRVSDTPITTSRPIMRLRHTVRECPAHCFRVSNILKQDITWPVAVRTITSRHLPVSRAEFTFEKSEFAFENFRVLERAYAMGDQAHFHAAP